MSAHPVRIFVACLMVSAAARCQPIPMGMTAVQSWTPAGLGLTTTVAGIEFDGSGSELFLVSRVNGMGTIHCLPVMRDPVSMQITGFGPPTALAAPSTAADGLRLGPGGNLFWCEWPGNMLGQRTPSGAVVQHDLGAAGVPSSADGLEFLPSGELLVSSYDAGGIYKITLAPSANGTFAPVAGSAVLHAPSPPGITGIRLIPDGVYTGSLLVSDYLANSVSVLIQDPATLLPWATSGNPIIRKDLLTTVLVAPWTSPTAAYRSRDAAFDPLTGDLFTSGHSSYIPSNLTPFVLRHFSGPIAGDYQLNRPAASLDVDGIQGELLSPAIVSQPFTQPVTVSWSSALIGLPFDIAISPVAPVVQGGVGLVLPGGQAVNLDLSTPFSFVHGGGFGNAFTPGSTTPSLPGPVDVSIQMVIMSGSEVTLSQATRLDLF